MIDVYPSTPRPLIGRGRGGAAGGGVGSICDICPLTSEEQEKNTHAESEIYTFYLFFAS